MKRINQIIIFFTISLLLPSFSSFASSRQDIINDTLSDYDNSNNNLEEQSNIPEPFPYTKPYLDKNKQSAKDSSRGKMSAKKEKAVNDALYKFSISAGYQLNHIHYSEWSGGNKADEDFGYQHGFYVDLGYKGDHPIDYIDCKPFFNFYYKEYSNMIRYKGATIGPPSIPVSMDERSKVHQVGVKLGGYHDISEKLELSAYLDIGQRVWHRGETQGSNYYERYQWKYYGPGVALNYSLSPEVSVGIDAKLLFGVSPKMWADLYGGGTFILHDVTGGEVTLPVKYYIRKNLSLDFTPYYYYWRINASDPVLLGGSLYYEPDSRTHEEGLRVGISYLF